MTTQTKQTSELTEITTHVHLSLETCPTCGQEIPADKIEEIGGRIAAREREQALAITLQLEKQYANERAAGARGGSKGCREISQRDQSTSRTSPRCARCRVAAEIGRSRVGTQICRADGGQSAGGDGSSAREKCPGH